MAQLADLLTESDVGIELTRDEFLESEHDPRWRFERVEGRLSVMPPPEFEHHLVTMKLRNSLGNYMTSRPDLVEYVFQESHTVIDDDTDRIPDIAVYLVSGRQQPAFPHRVPDIIFEIVSPGWSAMKRDYEEKRDEYERIGVCEYVIVDRFAHQLTVYTRQDGQFSESVLSLRDAYESHLLPGLTIPLKGLV